MEADEKRKRWGTLRIRTATMLRIDGRWYAGVRVIFYAASGSVLADRMFNDDQGYPAQSLALERARVVAKSCVQEMLAEHPDLKLEGMPASWEMS